MKIKYTPIVGAHVVFAGFDGGSYSATITEGRLVGPPNDQWVRVRYFPAGPEPVHALVKRTDWARLTLFGNEKFLAI